MKATKEKYQGFTVFECLVALLVISLVALLINDLIRVEKQLRESNQLKSAIKWHLFLIQLENSSQGWQYVSSTQQSITFKDRLDNHSDNYLIIEGGQKQLKKRKRGGYEPLLFEVADWSVRESQKGLRLKVEMSDGGHYESLFYQWQQGSEE